MKIIHDEKRKKFEALTDDGAPMGELEYRPEDVDLYATHTVTRSEYEGQGVARQMLDALVEYAVSKGLKVVPVCSYVVAAFEKNPDRYREVIKQKGNG